MIFLLVNFFLEIEKIKSTADFNFMQEFHIFSTTVRKLSWISSLNRTFGVSRDTGVKSFSNSILDFFFVSRRFSERICEIKNFFYFKNKIHKFTRNSKWFLQSEFSFHMWSNFKFAKPGFNLFIYFMFFFVFQVFFSSWRENVLWRRCMQQKLKLCSKTSEKKLKNNFMWLYWALNSYTDTKISRDILKHIFAVVGLYNAGIDQIFCVGGRKLIWSENERAKVFEI